VRPVISPDTGINLKSEKIMPVKKIGKKLSDEAINEHCRTWCMCCLKYLELHTVKDIELSEIIIAKTKENPTAMAISRIYTSEKR
jgi:hypothetical protein